MELEQIDIDPAREVAGVWFSFEVLNEQLLVWPSSGEPNGRDVGQLRYPAAQARTLRGEIWG